MQVTAVEIPVNDLLHVRPPEAILPGVMVVIDPHECLTIVLDAAVII